MRVVALFSTSFFAKYLRVVEDGPGQGHLCHTDTFLVLIKFVLFFRIKYIFSSIMYSWHFIHAIGTIAMRLC